MLYPQSGDRIVDIDSVTSLHPVYIILETETNVMFRKVQFLFSRDIFFSSALSLWSAIKFSHPPLQVAAQRFLFAYSS